MKYLATLLASVALATAHGWIRDASIGGKEYEFYNPDTDKYMPVTPERISRRIAGDGPIYDVTSADIQCGGNSEGLGGGEVYKGSVPAPKVAPAEAGTNVTLRWNKLWPDTHYGPIITYMAKCPGPYDCTKWLPGKEAVWFKVAEDGRHADGTWASEILEKEGNPGYQYTIPECLENGAYLVRTEVVAYHSGTQYFPGCHQIKVSDGRNKKPANLVSFPGAYKDFEYGAGKRDTSIPYTIPGPKLFTC